MELYSERINSDPNRQEEKNLHPAVGDYQPQQHKQTLLYVFLFQLYQIIYQTMKKIKTQVTLYLAYFQNHFSVIDFSSKWNSLPKEMFHCPVIMCIYTIDSLLLVCCSVINVVYLNKLKKGNINNSFTLNSANILKEPLCSLHSLLFFRVAISCMNFDFKFHTVLNEAAIKLVCAFQMG